MRSSVSYNDPNGDKTHDKAAPRGSRSRRAASMAEFRKAEKEAEGGGPRSGGNPYSKTKSGGSMGRTPGGATARLDGGILDRVQREG